MVRNREDHAGGDMVPTIYEFSMLPHPDESTDSESSWSNPWLVQHGEWRYSVFTARKEAREMEVRVPKTDRCEARLPVG